LAWVAKNPNTSTVILGASKPEQITENLKAIEVIPKLTPEVLEKIEKILGNVPETQVRRSALTVPFFDSITISFILTYLFYLFFLGVFRQAYFR